MAVDYVSGFFQGAFGGLTILISIYAAVTARRSANITEQNFRLSLFNRRFDAYSKILKYARKFLHSEIRNLEYSDGENFTIAFREAIFLFNPQIKKKIGDIQNNCSLLKESKEHPGTYGSDLEEYDGKTRSLEKKLNELEELMDPYLNFSNDGIKSKSKSKARIFKKYVLKIVVLLLFIVAICCISGVRVNTTKSIPVGLYLMTKQKIGKGDYIIFCPPKNDVFDEAKRRGYIGAGFCPGGYGYMMKKILAVQGDVVDVSNDGVYINEILLPSSAPKTVDNLGRKMPYFRTKSLVLAKDEFLTMSESNRKSFDSRYFGVIHSTQIKGVIRPIVILQ